MSNQKPPSRRSAVIDRLPFVVAKTLLGGRVEADKVRVGEESRCVLVGEPDGRMVVTVEVRLQPDLARLVTEGFAEARP